MTGPRARVLAEEAIALLAARGQTVAVAESLTGGLLAGALTAIPGASAAFRGGIVCYATDLKAALLDVPAGLLESCGAIDPQVAATMAQGARRRMTATVGVATTGVAGPDPAEGKPVGTVYIAVSDQRATAVLSLSLTGSRHEIRPATVERALDLLVTVLREHTSRLHRYFMKHAGLPSAVLSVRAGTVELSASRPREGSAAMVLLRHLLGDALRRLRLRQGRTLREVSAAARVSLGYLSEVERGQKEASSELLASICGALGAPLSQVLREVSDNFALAELQSEPVFAGVREPSPDLARVSSQAPPPRRLSTAGEFGGDVGPGVPVPVGVRNSVAVPRNLPSRTGHLAGIRRIGADGPMLSAPTVLAGQGSALDPASLAGNGQPFDPVGRDSYDVTSMVPV